MPGTTSKCTVCGQAAPAGHKVCDNCWPDKAIKAGKAAKCDLCGKPRMLDQGQDALETAAGLAPDEAIRMCNKAIDLFKKARELAVDEPQLQREAKIGVAAAFSQRGHQHRYNRNFAGSLADLSQGLRLN